MKNYDGIYVHETHSALVMLCMLWLYSCQKKLTLQIPWSLFLMKSKGGSLRVCIPLEWVATTTPSKISLIILLYVAEHLLF